jgi:hypothetical protein
MVARFRCMASTFPYNDYNGFPALKVLLYSSRPFLTPSGVYGLVSCGKVTVLPRARPLSSGPGLRDLEVPWRDS